MKVLIAATFALTMAHSIDAAAATRSAAPAGATASARTVDAKTCDPLRQWWDNTRPPKPHMRNKFGG
jgi:hypothetical protein